ncbi:transcription elongation factor SPT6 family protein [Babesia bovis T2Bo]|uniref:Suppressor of Ty 6 homolog n=1 Tax=Babesia bovis TaxID=5865 RepID=A7AMH1_BABBO|nr:transcription elongation factor SPT6 family protein [Babesia bovis T2Bo]EDO07755.1 transcription elongation factor SPT6 family protein [Babesia bovis T2Bo]|eukprot:XP_001611323.1 hypothetical protein [Babesia bovis T2Bo]
MADPVEKDPELLRQKRGRSISPSNAERAQRFDALKAAFKSRDPDALTKAQRKGQGERSPRAKYLDTMAEESEDDGLPPGDKESDSEEDDEPEIGFEIPDEMKGFIVDKVDDDEVSEESDASDVEYEPNVLDDDDLALIAENMGANRSNEDDEDNRKQLRRLKKGSSSTKDQEDFDNWLEDEYGDQGDLDLSDNWATVAECFGDVSLVVQILKNERSSVSKVEEDAGSDYENEDPEVPSQEVTLENLIDPDELAMEYMTKDDEGIREIDEPERLYLRYINRPRKTEPEDLRDESQWMKRRLLAEFPDDLSPDRIAGAYKDAFHGTYPVSDISPEDDTREKCEMVLHWLLNERWEVPFILYHKRHLICPPLSDEMVWRIYHLDAEWIKLKTLSDTIKDSIDRIGYELLPNDVLYYSLHFNSMDDLNDVNSHLRYHHRKALYVESDEDEPVDNTPVPQHDVDSTNPEDEIEDDIDEDDVFGDFTFGTAILETMDNPEHHKSPNTDIDSPLSVTNSPFENVDLDESLDTPKPQILPPRYDIEDTHESPKSSSGSDVDTDMDVEANPVTGNEHNELIEMDESELKDDELDEYLDDQKIDEVTGDMEALEVQPKKQTRSTKKRSVDMHLLDTIEKHGFHEHWQGYIPDAQQFASILESCIVLGSHDLRVQPDKVREQWNAMGAVGMLDAPSIIEGSEDQQVEDMCAQYCKPPYNGGKRLYIALVNYHTKLLANNITVRRLLREYYRKYCCITSTTTPKGEADVDVADPTWIHRRLYRFPLRELMTYRQVHYAYPKDGGSRDDRRQFLDERRKDTELPEMYLRLMQLEKEGVIKCTIHPLCANEVPPWQADDFSDRFADWYERYKVVTYSGNPMVNESYRARMGEQKSILEKEEMLLKDSEERDKHWRRNLVDQLAIAYCPSNVPTYSIWRHIQRDILGRLLNVELIPKFRMEIRDELQRNAQTWVLLHSQRMLQYKLDIAPGNRDNILTMAVEEPGNVVHAVVVNEFGEHKDYKRLHNLVGNQVSTRNCTPSNPLFKEIMVDIDLVIDLINTYRVSEALIGMANTAGMLLYHRLSVYMLPHINGTLHLKKVDIEVPRLRRGMIKDGSYLDLCVSMGRFYMDPVSETINLWNNKGNNLLLKLSLHPLQHLISQEKLQEYLEATLIQVVCDCGVDINRIRTSKHMEATLQFVAGLGPRKAIDVLRQLKIATIGTRGQLRSGNASLRGLGDLVFYNCASFIRINQNEAMDILDTTRLHPAECYYTAEKLCTDSVDDELNGEEAIQEIFNHPDKLDDLDLEAYSGLLLEKRNMPRMLPYLLFVKRELQAPFRDYRATLQDLKRDQEFCLALQIEPRLLRKGSHVMCRLDEVFETSIRATVLPFDLKATVADYRSFSDDVYRMSKDQNRSIQLRGTTISARVVAVDYHPNYDHGHCRYSVEVVLTGQQRRYLLLDLFDDIKQELGIKEDYLSPLVQFDVNHSKKPMLNEYTEKHKIHYRRVIRHPSYRMWPLNKIVAFLKQPEIAIGECCICPMSEWDRLNLVIKTCADPFNCATFVIYERNQRVPGELGKELILLNQKYGSIDQIIAQFCETLKLNLEEIYMHPKYKHTTDIAKAERDLIQESAMRPDGIAWAILPPNPMHQKGSQQRYHPLKFTLLVLPPGMELNHNGRSLQDSIYVDHRSFKLWTHHERSLSALIKWWKQVGYWSRNRQRELYNQEKAAMMRKGHGDNHY